MRFTVNDASQSVAAGIDTRSSKSNSILLPRHRHCGCIPQSLRWRVLDPRTGEAQAADLGYVVGHAGREARSPSRVGQKEMAIDFLLPPPTFGDVALDRTIAPRLDRPVDLLVQVGRDQDDTTASPWCSCGPS